MAIILQDGKGRGFSAAVTSENQLFVQSENHPHQHHESAVSGQVYQAGYVMTGLSASATTNILHIKNNSATRNLCVTYIRLSNILAGTLPAASANFELGFGMTYASGGSVVTPVQVNRGSGNVADTLVYGNNPTLTGTFERLDYKTIKASGDEATYNKEGSVILTQGKTLTIRINTDTGNTGQAYARVTFMMIDADET